MRNPEKPESQLATDVRSAIAGLHKLWGAGVRQITPDQHTVQVENIRAKIVELVEGGDPSADDLVKAYNINLARSDKDML